MDILPFNKWTLQFENGEYERLYQIEQNKSRLKYFRLMSILTSIVCTAIFVIYIVNKESVFAITFVALMDVFIIISLLNSHKFEKQMSYLFGFMYISTISVSLYLATQYLRKSLYILGLSTGSITAVSSLFFHYGMRIPLILLVPPLHLYFLDSYNIQDLQVIILIFFAQIQFVIYGQYNEYMNRLLFSQTLLNNKYKEIIQLHVPQSLFIIKLNQRTQQFELQLQNEGSCQYLNVEDTKSMINAFRNILVVPKGQVNTFPDLLNINLLKSGDLSIRRNVKRQTLEEFAFYKIKENNKSEQINELDAVFFDEKDRQNKIISIIINDFSYGQNSLLILIKKEKVAQTVSKDKEQIIFITKIIQYMNSWIQNSFQQIFQSIFQQIGNVEMNKLWNIRCIQLSFMNKCENFHVYLNQKKILRDDLQCKLVQLKSFTQNLEKYFSNIAMNQNKKFILIIQIEQQVIKVNTKYLTQILINLFEYSLGFIDSNQEIRLTITPESNLNPLKSQNDYVCCRKHSLSELNFIKKVDDEPESRIDSQKLIKFEFSFETKAAVHLEPKQQFILNPLSVEEYINNNSQELNFLYPITNFLIQRMGPYNTIQTSQIQNSWLPQYTIQSANLEVYDSFQNTIRFYIYTDQTQITSSFVKYIRQKSFLEI